MTITYKTLLEQANKHFSSPTDAEYVIQSLTHKKQYELFTDTTAVPKQVYAQFNQLLSKQKPYMPVQYLVNKTFFLSYEFYVDSRVFIPRPETEVLIEKTASLLKKENIIPNTILDIGTGSGAIAIVLTNMFREAKVVATDISSEALEVAKINIDHCGLANKIRLFHINLFPSLNTKYDLIISNPPYIPQDEIENLPISVKNYEPRIALDGGRYGFELIKRIINGALNYLAPNGLIAMEIEPRQQKLIKDLTPNACFEKDNQGFIRYAFIKYM